MQVCKVQINITIIDPDAPATGFAFNSPFYMPAMASEGLVQTFVTASAPAANASQLLENLAFCPACVNASYTMRATFSLDNTAPGGEDCSFRLQDEGGAKTATVVTKDIRIESTSDFQQSFSGNVRSAACFDSSSGLAPCSGGKASLAGVNVTVLYSMGNNDCPYVVEESF
jgi:hypothetical protein